MGSQQPSNSAPFATLGTHLKYLREQHSESLMETSGAVEIDTGEMERIEAGHVRPSEDVLLLLIQHYNMADQEAGQLWELAGYDARANTQQLPFDDIAAGMQQKQLIMLLAMDVRTIYSDGLDIGINQAGLTMNFTQNTTNNQRTAVARVGMSFNQAAEVLKTLETALLKAKYMNRPPGLPGPSSPDKIA